ncbi:hypothetical protein [Allostreptomyces psammosilenae]|uniref:Uncharacterized protein n=1 Tax=Allostreptomyces psammosilenae TaxID=1892865 RepID=A0A853A6V7_9ACTN|nr:hypothetical protein [Allostreptomyces psammosilenae]NYI06278.1 hypothetical protein [Allostreptomyces psammosilenae]
MARGRFLIICRQGPTGTEEHGTGEPGGAAAEQQEDEGDPVGSPAAAGADCGAGDRCWYSWRLVSPNNRELGRSLDEYPDYAACTAAVAQLQAGAPRLRPASWLHTGSGLWAWEVLLDGRPVAVCGRGYLRERDCAYNLTNFLNALDGADVTPGCRRVRRDPPGRPIPREAEPPTPQPAAPTTGRRGSTAPPAGRPGPRGPLGGDRPRRGPFGPPQPPSAGTS